MNNEVLCPDCFGELVQLKKTYDTLEDQMKSIIKEEPLYMCVRCYHEFYESELARKNDLTQ